jgi:hypothetical protein
MKGHIRERSPGHYAIILDLADPATGKRRRKWHSFKGTKRAAQIECAKLIAEMQRGSYVEPAKLNVGQYLERWLAFKKPNVSPRTYERYQELALKNLAPLLGGIMLTRLQPIQISEAYAKAVEAGNRQGRSIAAHSATHASSVAAGIGAGG